MRRPGDGGAARQRRVEHAGVGRDRCARRRPVAAARGAGGPVRGRPDQHPIHLGDNRIPEGCDAQPPQHPEQRILRRRAVPLHRDRPGLHPGAVLPLLRHGDGQPRVHESRCDHGDPRRRASTRRPPCEAVAAERCTSLYGVPTMFIAELAEPDFASLRPVQPADRDHGRIALPGRGDEAGHRADGDGGGVHLLRHDRDVAGVAADPVATTRSISACRRSAGSVRTSR